MRTQLHDSRLPNLLGRGAALSVLILLFLFGTAPSFLQASIVSASSVCEETDRSEENSAGERFAEIQRQSVPSSGTRRIAYRPQTSRLFGFTRMIEGKRFSTRDLSNSLQPIPPPEYAQFFV